MASLDLRSPLRLFAPAKVNLGLEVLGRRADGYHDVVTVLETISFFDIIDIFPSDKLQVISPAGIPENEDLVRLTLGRLADRTGAALPVTVRVTKRIPISAGLGGGSSDAGTILSALGAILGLEEAVILDIAAGLGSDVPFFVRGGSALATGTGTELRRIYARGRRWYVVVVPDLEIPGKTGQLYGELRDEDFTDGTAARAIADRLGNGSALDPLLVQNAFQRPLMMRSEVREATNALHDAGATCVIPSGAGPAVYSMFETFQEARKVADALDPEHGEAIVATNVGPDPNVRRLTRAKGQGARLLPTE